MRPSSYSLNVSFGLDAGFAHLLRPLVEIGADAFGVTLRRTAGVENALRLDIFLCRVASMRR
jgi:hypothetical protein